MFECQRNLWRFASNVFENNQKSRCATFLSTYVQEQNIGKMFCRGKEASQNEKWQFNRLCTLFFGYNMCLAYDNYNDVFCLLTKVNIHWNAYKCELNCVIFWNLVMTVINDGHCSHLFQKGEKDDSLLMNWSWNLLVNWTSCSAMTGDDNNHMQLTENKIENKLIGWMSAMFDTNLINFVFFFSQTNELEINSYTRSDWSTCQKG